MQKSGCSLCKSENPLYKKIPSEKYLLLGVVLNKYFALIDFLNFQFIGLDLERKWRGKHKSCSRKCGRNAKCQLKNLKQTCSCKFGFHGNPFTKCYVPPKYALLSAQKGSKDF